MDALYFRVSSDRQTTENQFEDLLQVGRGIRLAEIGTASATRIVYSAQSEVVAELATQWIYVGAGQIGESRCATTASVRVDEAGRGATQV